jgi:cellobiose phosphorylase
MKYGYFDDAAKEYVGTTPFTPIKWCNYVGTLNFGGIIDSTGGVLICKGDPALNRITKYIGQMPASDFKGSTLYIKATDEAGNTTTHSPFYVPTLTHLDKFENRVGLSYSTFVAEANGVRSEITVFVPNNEEVLLTDIKITNISGKKLNISIVPVYEFTHFEALKQLTNADWVPQTMTINAHKEESGHLVIEQYAFMKKEFAVNYVTASRPVASFDGDRREFLGNNEYGSWAKPLALEEDQLTNSECVRGDNIAALKIDLGELAADQTERTVIQLGQQQSLDVARPSIEKYRDLANVDAAFKGLADSWVDYLSTMQVETPDASFNSMINVHNPRQCHTTKNWSRYLSLYQLGYGARGIGFRDSSQDLLGVMAHMPEDAKSFAERLLSVQNPTGDAMHQYFPSTMEANEGDSREEEDRPDYYGDDNLWIVQTVSQYLKETGDFSFLEKEVPYYSKTLKIADREVGSVWDHLQRSVKFTHDNVGQHGLPLLGFADWNDTVNLPTGAESLMIASLYGKALVEMIEIAKATGKTEEQEQYESWHAEMKATFNDQGWDGAWWKRYYTETGAPIGSKENEYGQIYTNGQSWPVIAGFSEGERRDQSLNSVNEKLNTVFGIKLSYPGYNGFDEELGGVSTYPPGAKENGGIFLHSNPWVMIAETINGNGDRAFQYYNQINPASKNDLIDTYESEPYCYPQNVLGDEHPQFGMARNAWLSGTSSWTYVAGTQWIVGVRPAMTGLIIDPTIPKAWDKLSVSRNFRGSKYEISITNPDGISKGIKELKVDGKVIEGNIVPAAPKGSTVKVEAIMG